ncbi:MAG: DNA cytosine methyltransferase [Bacteroides sp.]|nr:DNA cytosine methyltransferase [Bacteroides sp.]
MSRNRFSKGWSLGQALRAVPPCIRHRRFIAHAPHLWGGGNQEIKIMEHTENSRIRKLTPLECWRLMGFDDEDFRKAEKVCSNSQLYKQAGNSIVVDVLVGILGNLLGENQ